MDEQLVWLLFTAVFFTNVGVAVLLGVKAMFQSPGEIGTIMLTVPSVVFFGLLSDLILALKMPYFFVGAVTFWSVCFRLLTASGVSRRRAARIAAAVTGLGFFIVLFVLSWDEAWRQDLGNFLLLGGVAAVASGMAATLIYRREPKSVAGLERA